MDSSAAIGALPSTRALAADLGVSRTTALLALEQLRAEGYVVARRGSGMFVAPQLPSALAAGVPLPAATLAEPPSRVRRFRGAEPLWRACARPTGGTRRPPPAHSGSALRRSICFRCALVADSRANAFAR